MSCCYDDNGPRAVLFLVFLPPSCEEHEISIASVGPVLLVQKLPMRGAY